MPKCSICGKTMYEGYCLDSGREYYCSDECLTKVMTIEEWEDSYEDGGDNYWTTWEEEDEEEKEIKTYTVNWNLFGSVEIEAESQEQAEELFYQQSNDEMAIMINEEYINGGLEVGTIEEL